MMNSLINLLMVFFESFYFHLFQKRIDTIKQNESQIVIQNGIEMIRKDGKFYVVVISIIIIFLIITLYLLYIDTKLKRLEKQRKEK
jgi:CcmD family protein